MYLTHTHTHTLMIKCWISEGFISNQPARCTGSVCSHLIMFLGSSLKLWICFWRSCGIHLGQEVPVQALGEQEEQMVEQQHSNAKPEEEEKNPLIISLKNTSVVRSIGCMIFVMYVVIQCLNYSRQKSFFLNLWVMILTHLWHWNVVKVSKPSMHW